MLPNFQIYVHIKAQEEEITSKEKLKAVVPTMATEHEETRKRISSCG